MSLRRSKALFIGLIFLFTNILFLKSVEPADDFVKELTLEKGPESKKPASQSPIQTSTLPSDDSVTRLFLVEAIKITLKNNVDISFQEFQSQIRSEQITEQEGFFDPELSAEISAKQDINQSASAFADPNVTDNQTQSWKLGLKQKFYTGTEYELSYEGDRVDTNSSFAGLDPKTSSSLGLTITQPLLKNMGTDANKNFIYLATNNLDISDFQFRDKIMDVVSSTENVYWDLMFSIEDLKVQQKSIERAKDLERRVKAQVEVGTLAPLEILQAKAEVASREEVVLNAEKSIQDNEDKLKNILNFNFGSAEGQKKLIPIDVPKFIVGKKIDLDKSIKEAFEKRPDYLAKKKELKNKNIQVKYNENQTYPSLDLVASYRMNGISGTSVPSSFGTSKSEFDGSYDTTLENMFSNNYRTWEVGLVFKYPIGNKTAKSRLTAAKLDAAQFLLDIRNKEKEIIVQVREAVRQLETDKKRIHAARVARKLAEEKLSAEEKKFEVGLSTSFNVLEFQTDLAEQQSKELKAIVDFNKSKIKFRRTLATTLAKYNIRIASSSTP